MPPIISIKKCKACGICADICPTDVFVMKKGSPPVIKYPEECWHCNSCVLDCPESAITLRLTLPQMLLYVDAKGKKAGL